MLQLSWFSSTQDSDEEVEVDKFAAQKGNENLSFDDKYELVLEVRNQTNVEKIYPPIESFGQNDPPNEKQKNTPNGNIELKSVPNGNIELKSTPNGTIELKCPPYESELVPKILVFSCWWR